MMPITESSGVAPSQLQVKTGMPLWLAIVIPVLVSEPRRIVGGVVKGAPNVACVDLTVEEEVREWIDEAAKEYDGIDILYANAGAARFHPLEEVSTEEWDFVLWHEPDVVFVDGGWSAVLPGAGTVG